MKGFQKGNKLGVSRKGIPNKTTATAKEAFQLAFEGLGGHKALQDWAAENRTEYYKIYGRLIPTDVNANVTGNINVHINEFTAKPEK